MLRQLTASPAVAKRFFERVDIAFHGYDDTTQELFEIPPVREFVCKLDEQFPFWLFFLSKHYLGLQCLLFCFLPPFLTDEGRSEIFPARIEQLLTRRWIPAMNLVCEYATFSEQQTMELTNRVMAYITEGRLTDSSHPRSPAPTRQVPSGISAKEVLSRVQVLRDRNAQWDEVLSELNPTGDTEVQQLLIEIRGPNMFDPRLRLDVIEDGCERALALSPTADALAALREATRSQDPFVRD